MIVRITIATVLSIFIIWMIYAPLVSYWLRRNPCMNELVLTFDDGPDSEITPLLLDTLKEYKIKAIFFVNGDSVIGQEDIISRMNKEGHLVGVHGQHHTNNLWQFPWTTIKNIKDGFTAIEKCGVTPKYYRAPHGAYNLAAWYECHKLGLKILQWDGIFRDWEIQSDGRLANELYDFHKRKGVILLHDGAKGKAQAGANRQMLSELRMFLERMKNDQ